MRTVPPGMESLSLECEQKTALVQQYNSLVNNKI